MLGLMIHVRVPPEKQREFFQAFELLGCKGESYAGCIDQVLYEEKGRPNYFLWMEEWEKMESLNAYMNEESFRMLLGALEVLGDMKPPLIVGRWPIDQMAAPANSLTH